MSGGIKHWIEKLSSESTDERHCACETIAGLSDQFALAPESLLSDVISVLRPLLRDSSLSVQISALGALRNLCNDNGDAARKWVVADPLTVAAVINLLTACQENNEDENGVPLGKNSIQLESIHLLIDLCGNCEEAVRIFNQSDGAKIVLSLLTGIDDNLHLRIAAVELLQILSENNCDLAKTLSISENLHCLLGAIQSPHLSFEQLYMKIVTCSILYNVLQTTNDCGASGVLGMIAQLFLAAVEIDFCSAFEDLVTACRDTKDHELKTKVEDLKFLLKSQQVALETIANIFTVTDSDDEWDDVESCEEIDSESTKGDMVLKDSDMDCEKSLSTLSTMLVSELTSRDAVAKVLACFNLKDLMALDFVKNCMCNEPLLLCMRRKFQAMLGCLSNLVFHLELDKLGGADGLINLFEWLLGLANESESNSILFDITGAVNSTVRKIASLNHPRLLEIYNTHLTSLLDLGRKCSDCTIQANVLRTISSIGCSIAKSNPAQPQLLMIAEFLFHVASEAELLWISAEALDAIFDVFAEDYTNHVLHKFQLVDKMQRLLPKFLQKCREQKKSCNGEQRLIVSTVQSNFARFISYKKSSCVDKKI